MAQNFEEIERLILSFYQAPTPELTVYFDNFKAQHDTWETCLVLLNNSQHDEVKYLAATMIRQKAKKSLQLPGTSKEELKLSLLQTFHVFSQAMINNNNNNNNNINNNINNINNNNNNININNSNNGININNNKINNNSSNSNNMNTKIAKLIGISVALLSLVPGGPSSLIGSQIFLQLPSVTSQLYIVTAICQELTDAEFPNELKRDISNELKSIMESIFPVAVNAIISVQQHLEKVNSGNSSDGFLSNTEIEQCLASFDCIEKLSPYGVNVTFLFDRGFLQPLLYFISIQQLPKYHHSFQPPQPHHLSYSQHQHHHHTPTPSSSPTLTPSSPLGRTAFSSPSSPPSSSSGGGLAKASMLGSEQPPLGSKEKEKMLKLFNGCSSCLSQILADSVICTDTGDDVRKSIEIYCLITSHIVSLNERLSKIDSAVLAMSTSALKFSTSLALLLVAMTKSFPQYIAGAETDVGCLMNIGIDGNSNNLTKLFVNMALHCTVKGTLVISEIALEFWEEIMFMTLDEFNPVLELSNLFQVIADGILTHFEYPKNFTEWDSCYEVEREDFISYRRVGIDGLAGVCLVLGTPVTLQALTQRLMEAQQQASWERFEAALLGIKAISYDVVSPMGASSKDPNYIASIASCLSSVFQYMYMSQEQHQLAQQNNLMTHPLVLRTAIEVVHDYVGWIKKDQSIVIESLKFTLNSISANITNDEIVEGGSKTLRKLCIECSEEISKSESLDPMLEYAATVLLRVTKSQDNQSTKNDTGSEAASEDYCSPELIAEGLIRLIVAASNDHGSDGSMVLKRVQPMVQSLLQRIQNLAAQPLTPEILNQISQDYSTLATISKYLDEQPSVLAYLLDTLWQPLHDLTIGCHQHFVQVQQEESGRNKKAILKYIEKYIQCAFSFLSNVIISAKDTVISCIEPVLTLATQTYSITRYATCLNLLKCVAGVFGKNDKHCVLFSNMLQSCFQSFFELFTTAAAQVIANIHDQVPSNANSHQLISYYIANLKNFPLYFDTNLIDHFYGFCSTVIACCSFDCFIHVRSTVTSIIHLSVLCLNLCEWNVLRNVCSFMSITFKKASPQLGPENTNSPLPRQNQTSTVIFHQYLHDNGFELVSALLEVLNLKVPIHLVYRVAEVVNNIVVFAPEESLKWFRLALQKPDLVPVSVNDPQRENFLTGIYESKGNVALMADECREFTKLCRALS